MKVYTKAGDNKMTDVIGDRVDKSSLRIASYGITDEALAHIGLVYYYLNDEIIKQQIEYIMRLFFLVGQDLANSQQKITYAITEADTKKIEDYIDYLDTQNEPLTSFILPAGHVSSCEANITRTIIRRAERAIVALSYSEKINLAILPLINRLSDYFFVLTRYLNKKNNYVEQKMEF